MPGGLNLLLLDAVLDGLGVDQLLQLLLLGDQEVVLVGSSLGGHLHNSVLIKSSKGAQKEYKRAQKERAEKIF